MTDLRVAAIQLSSQDDLDKNLLRAVALIEQASAAGARLIVLPENFAFMGGADEDKRALAETVRRNAQDALAQHKLKRAGDFTARTAALQSIQDSLGLAEAPLRIECVDISHVMGTDVVASLVVFEDGLPRKSDYRHYAIREAAGEGRSDDVASIAEVMRRRFYRHLHDTQHPTELAPEGKSRKFAYPPNLYVVDGGAPQVTKLVYTKG